MLDDEAHCLYRCSYPDLAEARELLLEGMRDTLPGQPLVTNAQMAALEKVSCYRLQCRAVCFIATCVRVAWRCFQAGGCDREVVPRPVLNLLPPELDPFIMQLQYHDNFDSASGSEGEMEREP